MNFNSFLSSIDSNILSKTEPHSISVAIIGNALKDCASLAQAEIASNLSTTFSTLSSGELFDKNSPQIAFDYGIDGNGTIVPYVGGAVSNPIAVVAGMEYTLAGLSNDLIAIQYQNAEGLKISFELLNVFPAKFTPPNGCVFIQFSCKKPLEATIPDSVSLKGNYTGFLKAFIPAVQSDNQNLFDKTNSLLAQNLGIDTNGNIVSYTGGIVSNSISVLPNTDYYLSGITTSIIAIQYQNKAGAKVGFVLANSFPFVFKTPSDTYNIAFAVKQPSDAAIQNVYLIKISDNLPFRNKKVVLYGDSITVDYNSLLYQNQIKAKTGAATVTRRGQSGQSYQGLLQTDSLINSMIADNPDLVIMHSVNDHRSNAPLGQISDTAGAATTLGGIKKIFNALITANPKVHIVFCTPITYGDVKSVGYPDSFGSSDPNTNGIYLSDFCKGMIDLCRLYGVKIVDLTSNCEFRPAVESTANRIFTVEGVHPLGIGYERMTTEQIKIVNSIVF